MELGALPIINENDTISTEEIAVGDNDTLSAVVAATTRAELLILLSDIDGLYDSDPHKNPDAKLIHEVSVNAVAPGFIRTDMVEGLDEDTLKKTIPANRFGTPEEVAELVGFLVSPNAGYITGNVISINGGLYT